MVYYNDFSESILDFCFANQNINRIDLLINQLETFHLYTDIHIIYYYLINPKLIISRY